MAENIFSYGQMPYSSKTAIQIDKIYSSKKEMQDNAETDGIYIGRYVLVSYEGGDAPASDIDDIKGSFGYDGTLWQKVCRTRTIENVPTEVIEYVLIADLSVIPPTCVITPQAPSLNEDPVLNVESQTKTFLNVNATKEWKLKEDSISINTSKDSGANDNAHFEEGDAVGADKELKVIVNLPSIGNAVDAATTAAENANQAKTAADNAKDKFNAAAASYTGASEKLNKAESIIGNIGTTVGPVFVVKDTTNPGEYKLSTGKFDGGNNISTNFTPLTEANGTKNYIDSDSSYAALNIQSSIGSDTATIVHNNLYQFKTQETEDQYVTKESYYSEEEDKTSDFIGCDIFIPIIDSCGHIVGKQKQTIQIPDIQTILKNFIGDSTLYQTNKKDGRIISTMNDALTWADYRDQCAQFCQDAFDTVVVQISGPDSILYSSNDAKTENGLILGDQNHILYTATSFGGVNSDTNPTIQTTVKELKNIYIKDGAHFNDVVNFCNEALDKMKDLIVYKIPQNANYILTIKFSDIILNTERFKIFNSKTDKIENVLQTNNALISKIKNIFSEDSEYYILREVKYPSDSDESVFVFYSFQKFDYFKAATHNHFGLSDTVSYSGFGPIEE